MGELITHLNRITAINIHRMVEDIDEGLYYIEIKKLHYMFIVFNKFSSRLINAFNGIALILLSLFGNGFSHSTLWNKVL